MKKLVPVIATGEKSPDTGTTSSNGVVTESWTQNEDGTWTFSASTSSHGFAGGAFDYLWNYTTKYKNTIKSLISPDTMNSYSERTKSLPNESKIYCTNISLYNPYYVNKWAGKTPDGNTGYATAVTITKAARMNMWGNNNTYSSQLGAKLDDSRNTPIILPNCVGFVNGRSNEIWNMALQSGYLVKDGSTYKIPSKNNKEVHAFTGVPNCNAYSFKDCSIYNGTADTTGYYRSSSPVPGAIACWRNDYAFDGQPGHVGFVEAVFNPGTAEEYIITSESGYCSGGVQYVVWTKRLYKSNNYKCGVGKLAYFLCSPICELASTGGPDNSLVVGDPQQPTEGEIAAMNAIRAQYSGRIIKEELDVGTYVRIEFLGNTKKDGSGSGVNKLGCIAQIVSKDLTQFCPYGLSFNFTSNNKKVFGYFQRSSIVGLEENISSEG